MADEWKEKERRTKKMSVIKPELGWLDDPEVFRVNVLPAHSDHRFYGTEEDCRQEEGRLYQSLNGEWQFYWSKNAAQRPEGFYREDFDCSGFGGFRFPAIWNWQDMTGSIILTRCIPGRGICTAGRPIPWRV